MTRLDVLHLESQPSEPSPSTGGSRSNNRNGTAAVQLQQASHSEEPVTSDRGCGFRFSGGRMHIHRATGICPNCGENEDKGLHAPEEGGWFCRRCCPECAPN